MSPKQRGERCSQTANWSSKTRSKVRQDVEAAENQKERMTEALGYVRWWPQVQVRSYVIVRHISRAEWTVRSISVADENIL